MTRREQVELLERIEAESERNARRARALGWSSVALAALALAVLLVAGYHRLASVREQVELKRAELAAVEQELAAKREELAVADDQILHLREWNAAAQRQAQNPERFAAAVQAQIQQQLQTPPERAAPTVYIQIVDESDRVAARGLAARLKDAGYTAPGIELVPRAANLRSNELRYSKRADAEEAKRLEQVLAGFGLSAVTTKYMERYEENERVRPNQFELWIARGGLGPAEPPQQYRRPSR
jgi:hypothetical protein